MNLPFGISISFNGNGNGKYVRKDDCHKMHEDFNDHLDRKLSELTIDRNQKLMELKSDLIEHINIKLSLLRNDRS